MVKIVKNPGNVRLNNLNDPSRLQCVNMRRCKRHEVDVTEKTVPSSDWNCSYKSTFSIKR